MSDSPGNEAVLLIADSERDADMLYAAGMFVPDPFTFLQARRPDDHHDERPGNRPRAGAVEGR